MVSSKDVAKIAGVSQTTVSRVLNEPERVKIKTRLKVLQAIEQLNYIPDGNARSLVKKKTNVIALISGPLSNPFFVDTTTSIVNYASKLGYKVNVYFATDENVNEIYSNVFENKVDGIILSSILLEDPFYDRISNSGIPFIFFNRKHISEVNYVEMDNFKAGEIATEYIIKNGHHKIAWIGGPFSMSTFKDRYRGFKTVVTKYKKSIKKVYVYNGDVKEDSIEEELRSILSNDEKPTAICAATDAIAITLLSFCIQEGFSVPKDISIIGIDNVNLSKHGSINLTTVGTITNTDLGEVAIRKLIKIMNGTTNNNIQDTLEVKLYERKTVNRIIG